MKLEVRKVSKVSKVTNAVGDTPGVNQAATLRTPGVGKATDKLTTGKRESENRKLRTDNRIPEYYGL